MSTRLADIPEKVRPYEHHRAGMRPPGGGTDWQGDCLKCGKERHFHVHAETGQYNCKVCGWSGNVITFLTDIARAYHESTTRADWRRLSRDRGIPTGVLKSAGIGWDGERWLLPVESARGGTVHDIRIMTETGLRATAGCKVQLWGQRELALARPGSTVWQCEGEWDALAMRWLLRELDRGKHTGDHVVAVPGATIFKDEWVELFRGKHVISLYDADDAGDRGSETARRKLRGVAASHRFVGWPEGCADGYDTRDFVRDGMPQGAAATYETLVRLLGTAPRTAPDRRRSDPPRSAQPAAAPLAPGVLPSFREVVDEFRKHILVSDDTVLALKVILATCLSNDIGGDPLWLYVVGAPSAGKTMLLSSTKRATERCVFRSTVTPHGLVSGWKDSSDPSLIPQLSGKTFVVKDFTEILTLPVTAQDEIYSTLRGAYDGSVDKSFGNGVHRHYSRDSDPPFTGFSMLAGVTNAIHGHRKASLGERFLKLQMRVPPQEHRSAINSRALDNIGKEAEMEERLEEVVAAFLGRRVALAELPKFTPELRGRLDALVELIAVMRAQVERDWRSNEISYRPVPEGGARLTKQLGKLAMLLACIDGKAAVDAESYAEMERVAFDTAHGFHLDVIKAMMELGGAATKAEVAESAGVPQSTLSRRFEDLLVLGAIEQQGEAATAGRTARTYRVAPVIAGLWDRAKESAPWQAGKNGTPSGRSATAAGPSSGPSTQSRQQTRPSSSSRRRSVVRRRAASA